MWHARAIFFKKSDALNFAFLTSAVPVYCILISTLFIFQVRPSGIFESKRMNELLLPAWNMTIRGTFFIERISQEGLSSPKCTVQIL